MFALSDYQIITYFNQMRPGIYSCGNAGLEHVLNITTASFACNRLLDWHAETFQSAGSLHLNIIYHLGDLLGSVGSYCACLPYRKQKTTSTQRFNAYFNSTVIVLYCHSPMPYCLIVIHHSPIPHCLILLYCHSPIPHCLILLWL